MDLDNVIVADIETNSLLEGLTKLHVLSVGWKNKDGKWQIKSTNKEEDIAKVFSNPNNTVVGHYFKGFDLIAIQRLYPNIEIKAKIIDTLPISWYLYNERASHGLDSWGETLGFAKVKIEDSQWENLSYELAVERWEGDVNINIILREKCLKLLRELYNSDEEILPVIRRLNFKIELQHIQSENKIKVDVDLCKKNLALLDAVIKDKTKEVEAILYRVVNNSDEQIIL